ncbi:MAG: anti-sigma regulatory factor [Anaerolineae bacterium]
MEIKIGQEAEVYAAAQEGKALARRSGFKESDAARVEIAISELARNMLIHAGGGSIRLKFLRQQGREGIEIQATDKGPGIANVELALTDGYSTSGGLGGGLPGVKRLMDEFEIKSAPEQGTTVRAVKWRKTAENDGRSHRHRKAEGRA